MYTIHNTWFLSEGSARLGVSWLSSVLLDLSGLARLGSAGLGAAWFGLTRLDSAWLGPARLGLAWLGVSSLGSGLLGLDDTLQPILVENLVLLGCDIGK